MIEVFANNVSQSGLSLHDSILEISKHALRTGTSEFIFQEEKETRVKDPSGVDFLIHVYNPLKYIGPAPRPEKREVDPLSPPYRPNVKAFHLQGECGHYLLMNKEFIKFGHLILSSDNPTEKQGDPLNDKDFHALSKIFSEFGNKGIAYYNSGIESGCSQLHKHVQYIPYNENPLLEAIADGFNPPFACYAEKLDWFSFENISNSYNRLMQEMMNSRWGSQMKAYNFMIGNGVACVVPRKTRRHKWNVVVNSLGPAGHMFVFDTSDKRIRENPMKVLIDVGFKAE